MMRTGMIMCAALVTAQVALAQYSVSGWSQACGGPVSADTEQGLEWVGTFCETVPKGTAIGAAAAGSMLWVKVDQATADQLREGGAEAEQMVQTYVKVWRELTGASSVAVAVKWGDLKLAEGRTISSDGNDVTFFSWGGRRTP